MVKIVQYGNFYKTINNFYKNFFRMYLSVKERCIIAIVYFVETYAPLLKVFVGAEVRLVRKE